MSEEPHGSYLRYAGQGGRRGCRCSECCEAKRDYMRAARMRSLPPGDDRHGTRNGWDNFGCRCDLCTEAHRAAYREYYWRTKAGAA